MPKNQSFRGAGIEQSRRASGDFDEWDLSQPTDEDEVFDRGEFEGDMFNGGFRNFDFTKVGQRASVVANFIFAQPEEEVWPRLQSTQKRSVWRIWLCNFPREQPRGMEYTGETCSPKVSSSRNPSAF